MKLIRTGDNKVLKIISCDKIDDNDEYRLSLFTYLFSEGERYLIKNTLSLEVYELTENEWNAVRDHKTISGKCIREKEIGQLVFSRCLVKNDHDDVRLYDQVIFLLKAMNKRRKGIGSYTILPTTACNARCIYCYEEGIPTCTMDRHTADCLLDFICRTKCDGEIKLRWFGGEPLAAADMISYICSELVKRDVSFTSSMTTNASLMTRELAKEAATLWKLEKVQISLDGEKHDYESRKRYISPERYNYKTVMQSIGFLADEGIRIDLRCNCDQDNLGGMESFLADIKERFGEEKLIRLYFAPLFQERHKDSFIDLEKRILELRSEMKAQGISHSHTKVKSLHLKTEYCMTGDMDGNIVIAPDGRFYSCEHMPENNSWGNIFDGVTDPEKEKALKAAPEKDEKCIRCPFLPKCTPYYKTRCPNWFEKCYEHNCIETEYELRNIGT